MGSSHSKVIGCVSRLSEGVSGGGTSLLGKDREDLGDVLADGSDSGHLSLRGRGDLGDSEGGKFFSLEVEFFGAFLLRFTSKFMGSNTVHNVDINFLES